MLAIREYRDEDHDAVWELHNVALREVSAHAGNGPWDADLHRIREEYLDDGGEFLVGLVDGCIVAMGALKRVDEGAAEIKRMRVRPERQGRGHGRAILQRLEQRAEELGFRTLRLETTTRQTVARRLYESAGYRETGRRTQGQFEVIEYTRTLAAAT
jgi:GNAT superfamily N-acetyltransferase